jgi:hypothetical protein
VRCEGFLLVGSPSYVEEDYQKIIREFTLFGCYRDLLFTAIRPRQFGLKGDFCSYEIGELIEATRQICQIKTRIATNLLHQISAREDVEVLKRDGCEDGANEYSRLSLERQREIAREELRNRGNPIFEEAAYLDPQAWDKDWETVHLSSFKINT